MNLSRLVCALALLLCGSFWETRIAFAIPDCARKASSSEQNRIREQEEKIAEMAKV